MNRIAEKLHGEIAEAELLTEAALEPNGTGAPAATAETDTAAAGDIDGQLPSLADRIRALQTELARS
jgi:hypothetical protein